MVSAFMRHLDAGSGSANLRGDFLNELENNPTFLIRANVCRIRKGVLTKCKLEFDQGEVFTIPIEQSQ